MSKTAAKVLDFSKMQIKSKDSPRVNLKGA